jgi:hypothetical protein
LSRNRSSRGLVLGEHGTVENEEEVLFSAEKTVWRSWRKGWEIR